MQVPPVSGPTPSSSNNNDQVLSLAGNLLSLIIQGKRSNQNEADYYIQEINGIVSNLANLSGSLNPQAQLLLKEVQNSTGRLTSDSYSQEAWGIAAYDVSDFIKVVQSSS